MASKIALLQMCCDTNIEANLIKALKLMRKVKTEHPDVQMMFLPECTDYVPNRSEAGTTDKANGEEVLKALQQEARSLSTWISVGGIHLPAPFHQNDQKSKVVLRHLIIEGSTGRLVSFYDKAHLFQFDDSYCESAYVRAGEHIPSPCDTPIGKLALGVCFDLRFPVLSHIYRHMGAQVLTYPSCFCDTTGEAGHWHTLLKARAIENQCYVVAAAQCGPKRYGHSLVVDPWGALISQVDPPESPGYCTSTIDLDFVRSVRERIPMRCSDLAYTCPAPQDQPCPCGDNFKFASINIEPDLIFYETRHSVAFVNLKPIVKHHVLVSSRRRVQLLKELSREERSDLMEAVNRVTSVLCESGSTNIAIQDGPLAGQTVPHTHFHVLPRVAGDFQQNDQVYKELDSHDKDSRAPRSLGEMISEAAHLRTLFDRYLQSRI